LVEGQVVSKANFGAAEVKQGESLAAADKILVGG
jgi:hypothetical protein